MPEVSIIMPVFNKSAYLEKAIQSILDQTFRDFELIVINDGSTDDSLSIARSFSAKDSRVFILDIPNSGVSHARNLGIETALGKYITFIDSDDYVAPEYIQNMYDLLCCHNVDIVISGVKKFWADCTEEISVHSTFVGVRSLSDILPTFADEQKRTGIYGICVAKMFPRTLVKNIRFDEHLSLAEDFDFYLQVYTKVEKLFFDDKSLYFYLQDAENSSVRISDDKIDYLSQLQIYIRCRDFLKGRDCLYGNNREIVEQLISSYLFLSLHFCPRESFHERFSFLHALSKEKGLQFCGTTVWQRMILILLKSNSYCFACFLTQFYHFARKCIGRSK